MHSSTNMDPASSSASRRRIEWCASRLGAILLFVVGVAALMLAPEALEQSLTPGEVTLRTVEMLDFDAMRADLDNQQSFRLQTAEGDVRVQCTAILAASREAKRRYRCERTDRRRLSAPEFRELMPRKDGWKYHRVDVMSSTMEVDMHQQPMAGLWMLPSILLAALGFWWLRRSAAPLMYCSARIAVGWIVALLLLSLLISHVSSPWTSADDLVSSDMLQREVRQNPWLLILNAVILGPVLEELVFRGAGWELLRRVFPVTAVVALTTAAFTIGHAHDWALLMGVICAGLMLAWLRVRTGSVFWCIVAHAAMNAMNLLLAYFGS
ncbi:MAG: CPBP family intramembrane glutamic endopeptidase [Luteimonas sp.]